MGPQNYPRNSNLLIPTPLGVVVCVCICACMLGEGPGRPPAPCSPVALLDLGILDLDKVSSWLSELINCTLRVRRGRCWPEVTQMLATGHPTRRSTWDWNSGLQAWGLASFLGMELPPPSVGWSARCHDAISVGLPGLLHLQVVT